MSAVYVSVVYVSVVYVSVVYVSAVYVSAVYVSAVYLSAVNVSGCVPATNELYRGTLGCVPIFKSVLDMALFIGHKLLQIRTFEPFPMSIEKGVMG